MELASVCLQFPLTDEASSRFGRFGDALPEYTSGS